jgi:midasin
MSLRYDLFISVVLKLISRTGPFWGWGGGSICARPFSRFNPPDLLCSFCSLLQEDTMTAHTYGRSGSPWEFNLRDVFRWCELYERLGVKIARLEDIACEPFIDILYFQRFRTADDQGAALERAVEVFGDIRANMAELAHPFYRLTRSSVHIGKLVLPRQWAYGAPGVGRLPLGLRRPLQAVAYCVAMQWPCMLVGPRSSGKSTVVDHLASVIGVRLVTIALTPASDISELLGGFEQVRSSTAYCWCGGAPASVVHCGFKPSPHGCQNGGIGIWECFMSDMLLYFCDELVS